jgi:Family of unknown function (DUF5678)
MINEPIILQPEWRAWLEQSAQQEARTPSDLVNEALEHYYRIRQREKLNVEVAAYEAMHAELWRTLPGKWVAIHQQQLVDHGSDSVALYRRIRATYPRMSVLIRQVHALPVEDIMWHSVRLEGRAK